MQTKSNRRFLEFEHLEGKRLLTCTATGFTDDFVNVPVVDDACELAPGNSITGQIEYLGDADVFRFEATAGQLFVFETEATPTSFRTEILYDGWDLPLVSNHDSRLAWRAPVGGPLFLRVSSHDDVGAYSIRMRELNDVPDELTSRSPTLIDGQTVKSTLELSDDSDVFAIQLRDIDPIDLTDQVIVRLKRLTLPSYPRIQIVMSPFDNVIESSESPELSFRPDSRATYFVRVVGTGAIGEYEIGIEHVVDDRPPDPNGSLEVVPLEEPITGRLESKEVRDRFAVHTQEGKVYRLSELSPGLDALALAVDGVVSNFSGDLAWKATNTGLTEISVSRNWRSGVLTPMQYRFVLTEATEDLPTTAGDGTHDFGIVAKGTSAVSRGRFDYFLDEDHFSVEIQAGDAVHFALSEPEFGEPLNASLRLIAPDGTELTTKSLARELSWRAKQSGRFTLIASGRNVIQPYEVEVRVSNDDHSDVVNSSTPKLQFGDSFTAMSEAIGDIDPFVIDVNANQSFEIHSVDASGYPAIRVFSPSGVELPRTSSRWRAFESGSHVVEVKNDSTRESYSVATNLIGNDDHANRAAEWATTLQPGVETTAELESSHDIDVLAVDAVIGQVFEFDVAVDWDDTFRLAPRIKGPNLRSIAISDSPITWKAPSTGRFYWELSGPAMASFKVSLRLVGIDDHADEHGDTSTPIQDGETRSGLIQDDRDLDVFVYHATENDILKFSLVSDADHVSGSIRTNRDAISLSDRDTFIVDQSGPIYLQIRATELASYTVEIEKVGTDVPAQFTDEAPLIQLGEEIAGKMDTPQDVDVYAFDATPGRKYSIHLAGNHQSGNIEIYDAEGRRSRFTDFDEDWTVWHPSSSGRHYIRVETRSQTDYSFTLEEILPSQIDIGPFAVDIAPGMAAIEFEARWQRPYHLQLDQPTDVELVRLDGDGRTVSYFNRHFAPTLGRNVYFVAPADGRYMAVLDPEIAHVSGQLMDLSIDDHSEAFDEAAVLIPRLGSASGEISHPFDRDTFVVDVVQDEILYLSLEGDYATTHRLILSVYSDDGHRVAERDQWVQWKADPPGRYYVTVRGVAGKTGSYDLANKSLFDLLPDTTDDVDAEFSLGELVSGQLEWRNDRDVFYFDVEANDVLQLEATCEDFFLNVNGANGQSVSYVPTSSETRNYRFEEPGRYFVSVGASKWRGPDPVPYDFRFTQLHDDPDSASVFIESTEDQNSLRSLTTGEFTSAAFETKYDSDVFRIDTEPGDRYRIEVVGESADVYLKVLAPDGSVADSGKNVGVIVSSNGGRYLIETQGSNAIADYDLRLVRLEDHHDPHIIRFPNDESSAKAITFGERYVGSPDAPVNERFYSFSAKAGTIYRVTGDQAQFFAADGQPLPTTRHDHWQGVVYHDWKAETSGDYFLVISSQSRYRYSFTLREIPDDIPNSPGMPDSPDAPGIPMASYDEPYRGVFDAQTDRDVIRIPVAAGDMFRVQATWDGFTRTTAVLLPDGATPARSLGDETWTSEASGDHFVLIESLGKLGPYAIHVEHIGVADAADLPDEIGEAVPILELNQLQVSNFYHANDADVFAYNAVAGRTVTVEVVGALAELSVQDDLSENWQHVSDGTWAPKSTGLHYVRARRSAFTTSDEYTISVREAEQPIPPSTQAMAPLITAGRSIVGQFDWVGQRSLFAIHGNAGEVLKFSMENENVAVTIDADGHGWHPIVGSGYYQLPSTGRHFINVIARAVGEYAVAVENFVDDHSNFIDTVPNRLPSPVLFNQDNTGVLEFSSDLDVFEFEARRGQLYTLAQTGNASYRLLDKNHRTLADWNGGEIEWRAQAGGTHFIEVSRRSSSGPSAYSFRVDTDETAADLTGDDVFSSEDVDAIWAATREPSDDLVFDVNHDGRADKLDRIVYLERHGILLGDVNLDGQVGFTDFLALTSSFRRPGNWNEGDFNGDGLVDFADFLLLSSNFGSDSQM